MRRLVPSVAMALTLCLWATACGDDGDTASTTTADAGSTTAGTASTETTEADQGSEDSPEQAEVGARVYFAMDEAVATAGRSIEGPAVAGEAIEALLEGPSGVETEVGMSSAIPEGTELLGVEVEDGVATVDLSNDFQSGGGSLSMQLRVAQVVFTLTQFASVDSVEFRIDGEPVEAIGGEGVLVDGVDRSDFAAVTPLILVESPVPGEEVSSPLEISGMSNTFEATVQYSVTDGDGLIVDEGFTTATAGNGTFGTFSVTSSFDVDTPGVGAVIAFEQSARDGSQVNVYEVPVQIG